VSSGLQEPLAPVRRIAVIVDAGEQSPRVIGLAAGIAAALKAELEGVFVEDVGLLGAIGLPFQREFRLTTRGEEVPDVLRLQRELRAAARRVRELLEQSAQRLGCTWSFRVWRGDLEGEIFSAARSAQMLALAPLGRFAPLRQTARRVAQRPADQTLVVSVLCDGAAGSLRALEAARELASERRGQLQVFLQAPDGEALEGLHSQVRGALGQAADDARLLPLAAADRAGTFATIVANAGDVLVIDGGNPLLGRDTLWQSLVALQCPMLVVR